MSTSPPPPGAATGRRGPAAPRTRWFPQYRFDVHKGYSTPEHTAAMAEHGPCPEHRFSYVNVAAVSGRGNRPPRARRPVQRDLPEAAQPVRFDASVAEPTVCPEAAESTVGVASGDQPQPSPSVGEDEAMEGENR